MDCVLIVCQALPRAGNACEPDRGPAFTEVRVVGDNGKQAGEYKAGSKCDDRANTEGRTEGMRPAGDSQTQKRFLEVEI